MAKFAPVAPIQVLEGLWAAGAETFGDYHLLLAHHTVEHAARFRDLFKRLEDAGWTGTIIMDNSIVELGDAVSADMVAEAVHICDQGDGVAIYPVLPDVMGDGEATRDLVAKEYDNWVETLDGYPWMVVLQGKDFDDYLASLAFFADRTDYAGFPEHGTQFPDIEVLGIPRVLVEKCGTRVQAMRAVSVFKESFKIHMLGFSDNITDDVDSACIIPGCGIDSAVPLRTRELFTEFLDAGKRPPKWFDEAQVDERMIDNLQAARLLFGGGNEAV